MMDSFELSKIAGAVFAALLLIFVPKVIIETRLKGHEVGKGGYALPTSEATAAAEPAKAEGAKAEGDKPKEGAVPAAAGGEAKGGGFDAKAVVAKIGAGNPDSGKTTFQKCAACHSAEKGAANKVGPNLWNVIGRKKAGKEDFAGYSAAMKGKGGDWTFEDLAAFLHNPAAAVSGTKMVFPGVKDDGALADLLAYMRTLADSPAALP